MQPLLKTNTTRLHFALDKIMTENIYARAAVFKHVSRLFSAINWHISNCHKDITHSLWHAQSSRQWSSKCLAIWVVARSRLELTMQYIGVHWHCGHVGERVEGTFLPPNYAIPTSWVLKSWWKRIQIAWNIKTFTILTATETTRYNSKNSYIKS